jgi:hypothetical protein
MTDCRDSLANGTTFDPWGSDGFDIATLFNEPIDDIEEYPLRHDPLPQGPSDSDVLVNHEDAILDQNASTYPMRHPDFQVNPLSSDASLPNALLAVDGIRDVGFPLFPHEVQDWSIDTFGTSAPPVALDNSVMNPDLRQKPGEPSLDPNALLVGHGFHDGSPPFLPTELKPGQSISLRRQLCPSFSMTSPRTPTSAKRRLNHISPTSFTTDFMRVVYFFIPH